MTYRDVELSQLNLLIVLQDSFDILLSLGTETFSDNPPIWPTSFPGFFPQKVVPPHPFFWGKSPGEEVAHLASLRTYIQWSSHFLKTAARGPDWGILFTCHLYKASDEKIHGDRRPDDGFKGGSIGFVFLLLLLLFFFMANTSQV